MAEDLKPQGGSLGKAEGHGDNTAPAGIQSPGTFVPLATEPTSANQKSDSGRKGKVT